MTPLQWRAAFLGLCAVLCLCAAVATALYALLIWTSGENRVAARVGALAVLLAALGLAVGAAGRRLRDRGRQQE